MVLTMVLSRLRLFMWHGVFYCRALTRIWSKTHTYSVSGEDAAPGEFAVFELCVGGTTCTVLTQF